MSYLTVKELHIGIDQELQYLDSNRKDSIRPEQKDWLLNSSLIQLIKNKVNPRSNAKQIGFEETTKRYDDLAPIKTGLVTLQTFVDSQGKYVIQPFDYLNIIKSCSNVISNCNNTIVPVTSIYSYHVVVAPFTLVAGNTYNDFQIYIGSTSKYKWSNYGYNLNTIQSKYIIVRDLIDKAKQINLTIYWERFDNLYYPDSFIFIFNSATNVNLFYNAVNHIYSSITNNHSLNSYTTIGELKQNDLRTTDNIVNDFNSHYRKGTKDKPLSWIEKRRIYVKENTDFKVSSISIEYLRRPNLINYYTNTTSELPDLNEELISLTVQKIKAYINDSNYNIINKENLNTE